MVDFFTQCSFLAPAPFAPPTLRLTGLTHIISSRFFRSNRPGYPHPVYSELENSGIRVAAGDCSVNERRRWHPPYQMAKLYICIQTWRGKMHGTECVQPWFHTAEPLWNVVTRIGLHIHTHTHFLPFYLRSIFTYWRLSLSPETNPEPKVAFVQVV